MRRNIYKTTAAALVMLLTLSACGSSGGVVGTTSGDEVSQSLVEDAYNIGGDDKSEESTEEGTDDAAESTTEEASTEEATEEKSKDSGEYAAEENETFEELVQQEFEDSVTSDTFSYHYSIKDSSLYGVEAPETATFGDMTWREEDIAEEKAEFEEAYAELLEFEDAELTEEERLIYDDLVASAKMTEVTYDNNMLSDPFSPMRGWQSNLPTNFTGYEFYEKGDVEDYISLLNQVGDVFDTLLEFEQAKADAGYFMSEAACEDVIEQCDEFASNTDENMIIIDFEERVDELDFLTDDEKSSYKQQVRDAVINVVVPAYERVSAKLSELKGAYTGTGALCEYEGGKEYYADYIIPKYASTEITPEELYDLMEEYRLNAFNEILMVYYMDPTGYQTFWDEYDDLFADEDSKSVDEIIDECMNDYMSEFPEIDTIPYTTDYMSESMEKIMDGVLAYYQSPAIDDTENNKIVVNGAHTDDLFATLAHEGCPGHMYQNTYFLSTDPKPLRALSGNLGYMEGWAEYSKDSVLKQYLNNETYSELYILNSHLGYIVYGQADIGVNYYGWTEEDLASFMDECGYNSEYAADIMETVTGDPGAYLSYSAGFVLMYNLRVKAEEAMGSDFDVVEFHDVILSTGPTMYEILEAEVDKYIDGK